jgi:hypothetical protein
MVFLFHIDKNKVFIARVMAIFCGLFILAACGISRTEKNCGNTKKENIDMTSETFSAVQNAAPLNEPAPLPAGQEIASFGMG